MASLLKSSGVLALSAGGIYASYLTQVRRLPCLAGSYLNELFFIIIQLNLRILRYHVLLLGAERS